MAMPTTSVQGPCGRRRRRRTLLRRSGWTGCRSSAPRSRRRSWRSAASTRATPPTAYAQAPPALPSSARRSMLLRYGAQSMRLHELGLLAELERRGLARDIEHDAASLQGGVVVTQDALVEGVHLRLDWISWRDLGWPPPAVNLSGLAASGADAEGLVVTLAAPGDTRVEDVLELYAGLGEPGVPVV